MVGIIVNVLSVALGGLLGTVFGKKMSPEFTAQLNKVFGVCAMGMGISSIGLMENMPAVILAVVVGTAVPATWASSSPKAGSCCKSP